MRHRRTGDGKKETGKEHTHNPSSVATAEPGDWKNYENNSFFILGDILK
jgi:hypothetical protein